MVFQAVLRSRMVEQLKRKLNTMVLGFRPKHYKDLLVGLTADRPDYCHHAQIIAMTLQANPKGGVDGPPCQRPPVKALQEKS